MRKIAVLCIVLLSAALFTVSGYCDGADTGTDDALKKLGRGVSNCVTFPCEVPIQICRANETDGPAAAFTWGVAKGLGRAVVRALSGVYEVVTFPIPLPAHYRPVMGDPEFLFSDSNWNW